MATATTNVHQSKWGYHPCDYEQFLFLKKAHKLLLRAYRDIKKWMAWERKTVYQPKEEPVHPSMFVECGFHKAGKKTWSGYGFKKYRGQNLYHLVLEAYQNARRPVSNPDNVKKIELPSDLVEQVKLLEAFYSSQS